MIHISEPDLQGRELLNITECIVNNWITMGAWCARFERDFAAYLGVKHALTCSSGTAALHLALLALGIGEGDEVIVPTLSYVATANAVRYTGATPIFVDVEAETWNIDPNKAAAAFNNRTKAVLPVHLYGVPADIGTLAYQNNAPLIEDAAEALGAFPICALAFSRLACFSFYGNKTITTGEGGMVVTDSDELADKIYHFRGQGQSRDKKYWHTSVGYNYRLTDLQAAIGCAQLESIEGKLAVRKQVCEDYRKRLPDLTWQKIPDGATPGYWMAACLLPQNVDRDSVILQLQERGVETRPVFYPLHTMPMYNHRSWASAMSGEWDGYIKQDGKQSHHSLPIAEDIARRGICLPTHTRLQPHEVKYVCNQLEAVLDGMGEKV